MTVVIARPITRTPLLTTTTTPPLHLPVERFMLTACFDHLKGLLFMKGQERRPFKAFDRRLPKMYVSLSLMQFAYTDLSVFYLGQDCDRKGQSTSKASLHQGELQEHPEASHQVWQSGVLSMWCQGMFQSA
jgi:hypothetical protein